MGLPSEDRPTGAANGSNSDYPTDQREPVANGQGHRRQKSGGAEPGNVSAQQERVDRIMEGGSEQQVVERARGNPRRPSGTTKEPKEQRICGKCGNHLTGQFVRALGGTYHLECFTCHVSAAFTQTRVRPLLT